MKHPAEIDKELFEILKQATPVRPRDQRRNRFGTAMLILSPFCVAVAFFPWPSADFLDKLMWLGFALVLLGIGAWQIDRSNQPEADDSNVGGEIEDSAKNAARLRRVK